MRGNDRLNKLYGVPYNDDGSLNAKWESDSIVDLVPPYPMRTAWGDSRLVTRIRCHRLVADSLKACLTEIYDSARLQVKRKYGFDKSTEFYNAKTAALLAELGLDQYGGAYEFRVQRGSDKISDHAYGAAIDLDPAHNAFRTKGRMPDWVVALFAKHGWSWGGDFGGGRQDPMHFQKP